MKLSDEQVSKLVWVYRLSIKKEEVRRKGQMSLWDKEGFARQMYGLTLARASIAKSGIRFFHESNPESWEECFDPIGDTSCSFHDPIRKAVIYKFSHLTGRLALSARLNDLSKGILNALKGFHGLSRLHVELMLEDEKEKIHCFREVTQIEILPLIDNQDGQDDIFHSLAGI